MKNKKFLGVRLKVRKREREVNESNRKAQEVKRKGKKNKNKKTNKKKVSWKKRVSSLNGTHSTGK